MEILKNLNNITLRLIKNPTKENIKQALFLNLNIRNKVDSGYKLTSMESSMWDILIYQINNIDKEEKYARSGKYV